MASGVKSSWKRETARDFIALGGLAFYFIVIGRAFVSEYYAFVLQLVFSAVFLVLFSLFFKRADYHIARSIVIIIFSIIFYQDIIFSIFAGFLFLGILFCVHYLKTNFREIIIGLILGGISALLSFYLVPWLV